MSDLRIEGLTITYGGAKALDNLSIEVKTGEFVALLGANGAGKTTTLRATSGLMRPAAGKIFFDDVEITKVPGHKRTALGIGHVLFTLSVNLG